MAWKFFTSSGQQKTSQGSSIGGEVAYNEVTADVAIGSAAVAEASSVTVVTASAFTADGISAYLIDFFAPRTLSGNTGSTDGLVFVLYEDGTAIGQIAEIGQQVNTAGMADAVPVQGHRRRIAAAGSRTYAIKAYNLGGGAGTVSAGVGGAGARVPAYIRITKVT